MIGLNRGARRALQSIVIDLSVAERDAERPGDVADTELVAFESYNAKAVESLTVDEIRALLVESGQWTALRSRPYSKVPAIDSEPAALFVTAMDSHPLAPLPEVVLDGRMEDFDRGLKLLSKLTHPIENAGIAQIRARLYSHISEILFPHCETNSKARSA